MYKSISLGLILFLSAILPIYATDIYIPTDYSSIQEAIENSSNGDTIIVSPGTYFENINFLGKKITLTSTNPADSDVVSTTILFGNYTGTVVTFDNSEDNQSVLAGFTITGGISTGTGGRAGSSYNAAGITCYRSSPVIKNNIITDNAGGLGGQNPSTNGGGISCYNSEAIITGNIIKNNVAYRGGGIYLNSGSPIISNNLIYDNAAYYGGGIYCSSQATIINNTISYNLSDIIRDGELDRGYGGNIYCGSNNTTIKNNIISHSQTGSGIHASNLNSVYFQNNNVWGNIPGNYYYNITPNMNGTSGNISQNPLFLNNDFRIGTNSPCYNAGDPFFTPYSWQTDIDGEYPVMDSAIDIGADEITGNPRPVANAGQDLLFDELVSNVTLDGTSSFDYDGEYLSWSWEQIGGPNITLCNADTPEPNFSPTLEGEYYFSLTVFDGANFSNTDTVMIVVGNRAPVANAGSDKSCKPNQQVTLNGSGSYDPDPGDTISYSWIQISGPSLELSGNTSQFLSVKPSVAGDYVFQLIVNDGAVSSEPDTVTIVCNYGSGPDAFGYSWIDSDNYWGPQFYWIDITETGTKLSGVDESLAESFGPFPMGFDFNFYGYTYDYFYIQSEGLISFGPDPITYSYYQIPNQDGYDNIIAWMWNIHYPQDGSEIYYQNFEDYTVIQFNNYFSYYYEGRINAEVILYKSGRIVLQYKDFTDIYPYCTIGIENADGTIGTQVAYSQTYLHEELAIEFSLGGPYEPVAKAGNEQQHKNIELITLDGTDSIDRDANDILTYRWTQVSGPEVILSDPNSPQPTFLPDVEGYYAFELVVNDGVFSSAPDQVVIIVGNRAPIANAGSDKACEPKVQTSLNGAASYDPDTIDSLSYSWTQVSGPEVELSNPNSAYPSFTAPTIGEYVFELIVSDGDKTSQPDTVTIKCMFGSLPDEYGYRWIDSDSKYGPKFNWIDITNVRSKITNIDNTLNEVYGPYSLGFSFEFYGRTYNKIYIQTNGVISFGSSTVDYNNNAIPLDDGYNNMIAMMWALMYDHDGAEICYKSFSREGYYVIQFVNFNAYYCNNAKINAEVIIYKSGKIVIQFNDVTDDAYIDEYTIGIENYNGTIGSQVAFDDPSYIHDGLAIEFSLGGPYEPTAYAGPDQAISGLDLFTLDGTDSADRDPNDVLTYQWTQIDGPAVTLSDSTSAQPTFTPITYGEYTFELVVSDGTYTSVPDQVTIAFVNEEPIANAGNNQSLNAGQMITLDGTGSYDPEGERITYSWTQVSGQTVELADANTATPYFTPTSSGEYVFELIVNDGYSDSQPAQVTITTIEVNVSQRYMTIREGLVDNEGDPAYSHYPDVSGDKFAYSLGPVCDYSWDIDIEFLETCEFDEFYSTCPQSVDTYDIDTQPKIDGDIVVWFGGPLWDTPWTHEPSNFSVFMRRISTKEFVTLREHTMSESYSHPVISGNKVVWLEHLNLDPSPTGSSDAVNWWNTPYNICGADISDWENVQYFTIDNNVGTRDPYSCHSYGSDFDDVIDICGNLVVYEANGDIYGAEISDINNIRVFTICDDPARQYDPAIYGNFVVWTDTRNDEGDIYGADISNLDYGEPMEFALITAPGTQQQPAFGEHIVAYVDGNLEGGSIKAFCIAKDYSVIDVPLTGSPYGTGPATDGRTIVWQTASYGHLEAIKLDFSYSTPNGPVLNADTGKRYDYIQFAINDSNEGDTIITEPGLYRESINTHGKNITLTTTNPDGIHYDYDVILIAPVNEPAVIFADGQDANCVIEGFTIGGSDIGIYCENFSSPLITKCNLVYNRKDSIFLHEGCEPIISSCNIMHNNIGGIRMTLEPGRGKYYCRPTIINCLITQNAQYGISGGKPLVINCTIANNNQYGLYDSQAVIENSIIYDNGDGSAASQVSDILSAITYSDIQGSWPGTGNINSNPMFVNSDSGNYLLISQTGRWDMGDKTWVQDILSSPCIDKGNPASSIGNEPSPNGSVINMGAYGGTNFASKSP